MRKITEIIVHCTATPAARDVTAAEVDAWHKARGFGAACQGRVYHIGYHWLVRLDGRIEPGRPEELVGAHCRGHNLRSIGVVYAGGVAPDGKTPLDTRTPAQKAALRRLLTELKRRYPRAAIHGHRDYAAKACPSFDATREYRDI